MPVFSWLASPRETRSVLERYGLATKHHLGQNFLVNDAIIGKILDLAQLGDNDVVFEIGPGIGTLTVAMLAHAGAVVSVEADRSLQPVLAETCARDSDRFALVMGDALRVSPAQLREAVEGLGIMGLDPHPTKLVSNLPYQVAATVVLKTFEQMPTVERAVVMVQAEVADRMAAVPGSRALPLFGKVRLVDDAEVEVPHAGNLRVRFGFNLAGRAQIEHHRQAVVLAKAPDIRFRGLRQFGRSQEHAPLHRPAVRGRIAAQLPRVAHAGQADVLGQRFLRESACAKHQDKRDCKQSLHALSLCFTVPGGLV